MLQFPPAGAAQVHVLERAGRLWRVGPDGRDKQLLLDFSQRVGLVDVENGALGFDHHPEFGQAGANAGYIYVYYTDVAGGRQLNRLSRFDLAAADPAARLASETVLIEFRRNNSGFHNGGSVEFGPDRFLYLAIGEATNIPNHQRIDRDLLGGVLRLDVDRKGGAISHPPPRQPLSDRTDNYFIPNDNPFVGQPDALEEFWAIGLRNPFRIAFDPDTGKLWTSDVGSTEWEEVNILEKGGNYQFPYIEGVLPTGKAKPERILGKERGPVFHYPHTANDRAVIGGTVYRGQKHQALRGKFIFADNYSGRVMAIPATGRPVNKAELLGRSTQVAQRGITAIVSGPDGDLWLSTLGAASRATGQIWKLVPLGTAKPAAKPTDQEAPPDDVAELYNTHCARCHGAGGHGDGPDVPDLKVKPTSFADPAYARKRTDQNILRVIRKGGPALKLDEQMPPWEGILSEQEMQAMLRHLRGFQPAR
ncbi:MAG: c-type cytochrome [Alphaproteobacteria bacterium]|nr:c-type cytochrome [Alphaproteobacteria bacterium]